MALFFSVILGIAGLCVLAVFHQPTEERVTHGTMTFDRTVAEGMRLWNPKTGVDSFRFDVCRTEKMRWGAFTLGWFDVLCLEGLVLNLPLEEEDSELQNRGRDGDVASKEVENVHALTRRGRRVHDAGEALQRDAGEALQRDAGEVSQLSQKNEGRGAFEVFAKMLPQSLLRQAGVSGRNFAGIQIKGFAVNKVENRREVPVFAADGAKNYRQTLKLRNCRVFEHGRTNRVGVAYIVLKPAPALLWKDGMRRLDDLFPDLSEMRQLQNRGRDVPVASKEVENVHALTRRGRRVHVGDEVLQLSQTKGKEI